jgi:hypothetical protein
VIEMVAAKAKSKANEGFSTGSKKLKKLTKGANKALKGHYGEKYRMNTKAAGKELGLKKKLRPK